MTQRLPSLNDLERRVSRVEQDVDDTSGTLRFIGAKTQETHASVKQLGQDVGLAFAELRADLSEDRKARARERAEDKIERQNDRETLKAERQAERDAARKERIEDLRRQSATDLKQAARLARLESAGKDIKEGGQKAAEAGPAITDAVERLHTIGVPSRGASLQTWVTFLGVLGLFVWQLLKQTGIIK